MIKSLIVSGAVASAAAALASPALAGPYVNVENNAGFAGGDGLDMDFTGSVTDLHIGYEGGGEHTSWYMQAGPALIAPDAGDTDVEFSGKIGGSVVVTADEKLSIYGEISFLTVDDFDAANVGTKIGAKFNF
jgi:hypothetical protein